MQKVQTRLKHWSPSVTTLSCLFTVDFIREDILESGPTSLRQAHQIVMAGSCALVIENY